MTIELNFFLRHTSDELCNPRPVLPEVDTLAMLNAMPDDGWIIPDKASSFLNQIREDELDFNKEHKIKSSRKHWQRVTADWIPFFDAAKRGHKNTMKFINEGIATGSLYDIHAFEDFRWGLLKHMKEKNIGYDEAITSCRNAFLFLLTSEQARKLNHKKPDKICEEDIENSKTLINNLCRQTPSN